MVVIAAHPYPNRSRVNRVLTAAVVGLPGVDVRPLYDLYPDFSIDVEAEQQALEGATAVVWQHPLYWYSVPALLKLWFERVLTAGWAYGPEGNALRGKQCLWVVSTGGDERDYRPAGIHQHVFEQFVPAVRQTAQFCGMEWLEPLIVHGAHRIPKAEIERCALRYRARVEALRDENRIGDG